eukprot:207542-Chlamydomonas_euryale.AAC.1
MRRSRFARLADEPRAVLVVDETVVEDAEHLVRPQPLVQRRRLGRLRGQLAGWQHHDALHDTCEVAQVEHVVRLGRRRQQFGHSLRVDLERRRDERRAQRPHGRRERR